MTSTTPSRGRRRAPSKMERAAGRAAALQKPRVILALLLLLGLTSVMLLDGYLRSEIGNDSRVRDGAAYDEVPEEILDGGPLLTFNNGTAKTQSVPKKTIVLTFDDGPTGDWTPKVLKVLEDNDVEATFFMVGSMVSRYPSIAKDLVDQGNEVGIHTFTHVDLSYQTTARLKRELTQTQLALAGAAGVTTTLFRAKTGGRDRYFDALRAVALVRVVTYHTFGWAWAGMVFPSMGVMFALAGTLMAKSLERSAFKVVKSRMRRLLPPFWFWGFFVVVAMLIHDWMPGWQIVFWILPVGDPPGNQWGVQAWEILWYLRTYLWFVLLSPLLLWVFRKAPIPVLLLSLAPIMVFQYRWQPPYDRFGSGLTDLATYLFCWLVGFAHREGVLQRLKPALVVVASLGLLAYGGWYAFAHQAEFGTYDLDEIPLAQTFWSAGFVTLLMYFKAYYNVDFAWLARFKRLDQIVTIFNGRAVTIYLWHEIALILAVPLIDQFWKVPAFEKWLPLESQWFMFGIGWVLIWIAILLFGWVEDVAAKKKPKLLP